MNLSFHLRCFFVFLFLTACTEIEQPVRETEVPIHATDTRIDVGSLSGKIVYSSEGDIFVVHADGTGRTQLTDHPAEDFDPVWSADGTQIAFRSHRDGDEEVYLMNADGSAQRNLSNAPGDGDYSPAWSPDGEWIAFMSDRAGNNNIWVIRPDGSGLRQVTDIPGISEYPSWSADGGQIAFHCTFGRILSNGTGDFEICTVNFDGSELVQLTDAPGQSKLPAWSPDGTKLAFETDRDGWPTLPEYEPLGYDPRDFGDPEIYIMNVDGSEPVNLTNYPREGDTFPAWSRDGHLIFSRYGCLMIMKGDGSDLTPFDLCQNDGQFPDWYQP
jgi:Tol biopolymer transport system component